MKHNLINILIYIIININLYNIHIILISLIYALSNLICMAVNRAIIIISMIE